MIYITGDLHGDLSLVSYFSQSNNTKVDEDIMIVLGDAGFNYYGDEKDSIMKHRASKHPITYFCIHGNHEMRPTDFAGYKLKDFCGGLVYYQKKYPNILFAKDGEIYRFGDYDCMVIGGAYSVDKDYRLARGLQWFANEQPNDEIKQYVEQQLEKRNYQIDIVLSHTCPVKYEPVEKFLPFIDQSKVDKSTEIWLDSLEDKLDYKKWYCGHYHTDKKIDKLQFVFHCIEELFLDMSKATNEISIEVLYYEKIKEYMTQQPEGSAFAYTDFLSFGDEEDIDKALKKLKEANFCKEYLPHIYYCPWYSQLLDKEMGPISNSVAYAVARNNGWKISPSLIHAENTLGLSTQVPAYSIFISTGPSCKYRVNGIPVEFVHSSEEYLNHMSTVPSMVVTVLKDIDNEKSIEKAISIISNRLSEEHKDILNCELQYVPENIKPYFIQIINS